MLLYGGNTVHSSYDMRKIDKISEIYDFCNFFKIYEKSRIDQQEKQKLLKKYNPCFRNFIKILIFKKAQKLLKLVVMLVRICPKPIF